jgi:hypothetical protein
MAHSLDYRMPKYPNNYSDVYDLLQERLGLSTNDCRDIYSVNDFNEADARNKAVAEKLRAIIRRKEAEKARRKRKKK